MLTQVVLFLASAVAAINASGVIATINVSGSIVDFYCLRFEDDV